MIRHVILHCVFVYEDYKLARPDLIGVHPSSATLVMLVTVSLKLSTPLLINIYVINLYLMHIRLYTLDNGH